MGALCFSVKILKNRGLKFSKVDKKSNSRCLRMSQEVDRIYHCICLHFQCGLISDHIFDLIFRNSLFRKMIFFNLFNQSQSWRTYILRTFLSLELKFKPPFYALIFCWAKVLSIVDVWGVLVKHILVYFTLTFQILVWTKFWIRNCQLL